MPPRSLVWLSLIVLALEYAIDVARFPWLLLSARALHAVTVFFTGALIATQVVQSRSLRERWGDALALLLMLVVLALAQEIRLAGAIAALRNLWRVGRHYAVDGLGARLVSALLARPLGMLVTSFGALTAVGALALMAPAATTDGTGAPLLTALFTATSAACVTGLTVVDTASFFSRFGHWVILGLMQIGGLGMMTVTAALGLAFGKRLSAPLRGAMQEVFEDSTVTGVRRTIIAAAVSTVLLESLGAFGLYPYLTHDAAGASLGNVDRWFYALFHAVSAFCNAGFSLYPDSLVRFASVLGPNVVVGGLVFLGGLGFPVLVELVRAAFRLGPAPRRLSVHARLTLLTSAALVAGGAVIFSISEWSGALSTLSWPARFMAGIFQSISFRTAGFNSVPFTELQSSTLMLGLALMFIGGAPTGTAGGIKVTTVAVLALAVKTMIFQRREVEVYGRTIDKLNVYRAVAVAVISGAVLFTACLALLFAERGLAMNDLVFEAVSAFGTVGLSTGVTSELSSAGRVIMIVLMFAGRIGPFSIALLVGERHGSDYAFPKTHVVVG